MSRQHWARRRRDLVGRLEVEWGWWCAAPPATAALARWARREAALAGFDDLEQLRTVVHDRRDPARSDTILAALVRQAAVTGHGDQLAAGWCCSCCFSVGVERTAQPDGGSRA